MYDALIISDIHLGSQVCQTTALNTLLQSIHDGTCSTNKLILNGDVFDSWDFRRLTKHHWKVLSNIRKLTDKMDVIWINGNHDGPAEVISHLIGVQVMEEYSFISNGKKILVLHGDRFDKFIANHPIITAIADFFYHIIQRIDPSFWTAKKAKLASKTFLRCVQKVKQSAIEYARKRKCDIVCCGHTHHAESAIDVIKGVTYHNSGCWTELPGNYIVVENGMVQVK